MGRTSAYLGISVLGFTLGVGLYVAALLLTNTFYINWALLSPILQQILAPALAGLTGSLIAVVAAHFWARSDQRF